MTNAEFLKTDEKFLLACEAVARMPRYTQFKPSTRQASKWRSQKGIAYKVAKGLYRDKI